LKNLLKKYSSNDVSIILFTDEKTFATLKTHRIINWTHLQGGAELT